jgi:curved DNA-binding protein CbpA
LGAPRPGEKDTIVMPNQAFEVLGIAPTEDGRAIRAAFLRLARIYHPDRFLEMPADVREEAERRMKEATTAYELLRDVKPAERKPAPVDENEVKRRAKKYREAIESKRKDEERDRARWKRWDEAEQLARENAMVEADIAARIRDEVDGKARRAKDVHLDEPKATPLDDGQKSANGNGRQRDPLAERLDAVRRGVKDPIARRSN